MKHYSIAIKKDTSLETVVMQLRGIEIPCAIEIYDRAFIVETKDELRAFMFGLEVGNYIALDKKEAIDMKSVPLDPQAG
jgi:hypothetical protein